MRLIKRLVGVIQDVMGQGLLGNSLWEVQIWVCPCHVVLSVDRIVWATEAKA